ncbi:hypothetical protein HETIRDRAFT_146686 [Heterobasidion irregulare TC 32-1]|uniref:Uncharacterized protein n=1 Tax=Heterobasidion irregulare (strain TC 32-1) TaxID=747525 RepID=W4KDY9_HETIT|nr:uncharacterized protein HETIRDRAFT_146686 [Heterobasidion irregulare TC 32-1]ETW83964.1 hypothetical protein HETIRDRAFT_146686 [Heterobasidion irregulare TC 32-1]
MASPRSSNRPESPTGSTLSSASLSAEHTPLGSESPLSASLRHRQPVPVRITGEYTTDSIMNSPTPTFPAFTTNSTFGERLVGRTAGPSRLSAPTHKLTIRADPTMVTCFDPADKELYNLWVPRS